MTPMEHHLTACIQDSLGLFLYDNARFLCERLVAQCPSEGNKNLLATCYYHSNQAYRAVPLLKGLVGQSSRYMLAVCCVKVGKLQEARDALLKYGEREIPNGAAGLYLLGHVYRLMHRTAEAKEAFVKALKRDPLLWCAYEELCALGGDTEAEEVCRLAASSAAAAASASAAAALSNSSSTPSSTWEAAPHTAFSLAASAQQSVPSVSGVDWQFHSGGTSASQASTPSAKRGPPSGGGANPAGPLSVNLFGPFGTTPVATSVPSAASIFTSAAPPGSTAHQAGSTGAGTPATASAGAKGFVPGPAPVFGGGGITFGGGTPSLFITPSPSGAAAAAAPAGPHKPGDKGPPGAPVAAPFPGFQAVGPVGGGGAWASLQTPTAMLAAGRPAAAPGQGGRGHEEGAKVRKFSSKLFQEPASSLRRSSRLAAINSGGLMRSGAGRQQPQLQLSHAFTPVQLQNQAYPIAAAPFPQPAMADGKLGPVFVGAGSPTGSASVSGRSAEGHAAVLALMSPVMEAVRHLRMFRGTEALAALNRCAPQQHRTAWVFCQLGRAYAEMNDYPRAVQSFEHARSLDRLRVESMEVYSTVLWHLRKEAELSCLAQEMIEVDRLAPQAWCVLGNFFSLQREHEVSIEFFQRAIQLDPSFAYAHTLAGHEHLANQDFDKAQTCYRSAYKADARHYNALYGLGQVLFMQEKYSDALYHFRTAVAINRRSSVLHCFMGMAMQRGQPDSVQHTSEALQQLQDAIDLDPRNPLARLEKASVLTTHQRYDEAMGELEAVARITPREASVYFQMGKLCKRMGDQEGALRHMQHALSLKLSTADDNVIKAAIDKLDVEDKDEEEEL